MKSIALAATLVALLSGTSHAADLTRKAPPALVAPVASWTGFYAGVNVGGGWSNTGVDYGTNDPIMPLLFALGVDLPANGDRIRSSGVLGGVQIGYNYQFAPTWVAGIEADFQFSDISGSGTTPYAGGVVVSSANQDIKSFGTVRARLGYLATDTLLVYATGGFAYAQLNNDVAMNIAPGAGLFVFDAANGTSTNCGFGFPTTCFTGSSNGLTPGLDRRRRTRICAGAKLVAEGRVSLRAFRADGNGRVGDADRGNAAEHLHREVQHRPERREGRPELQVLEYVRPTRKRDSSLPGIAVRRADTAIHCRPGESRDPYSPA